MQTPTSSDAIRQHRNIAAYEPEVYKGGLFGFGRQNQNRHAGNFSDNGYYRRLHLVEKFNKTKACVEKINGLLGHSYDTGDRDDLKEARGLTEEILNWL